MCILVPTILQCVSPTPEAKLYPTHTQITPATPKSPHTLAAL